ncbi:ABC transporter ATP-binding protein [Paracoccus sp. (in: a-proteobacteria)]|uniref:ABC transporter ATP-binding protein n=1 Tax=Paracoccus sp. TaxID=267 RepID=UPI00289A1625|nr:ABC transporter ATP-binding protein [Paracoccus sp. (in: a-proteobacteria)]
MIKDLTLQIPKGEVLVVLGPSGCGKTTLLRLIAGLVTPSKGQVLVQGHPPRPGAVSATVFQNFRLLPWKTVAENLAFVLPDLPATKRAARIEHYLHLVGLSRFAASYPRSLSGGMQQRVALARALCAEPQILLMDEPFASLDAQSRELMQGEVLKLSRSGRDGASRTVVFVTHSVDEALLLGDRILLMSPRPGRIAELIDVPFARQSGDPRSHADFNSLRERLWGELRQMVLNDPQSDFYGRG